MSSRRLSLVTLAIAACLAMTSCGGTDGVSVRSGSERVDVIFDNASFVTTGQDVRIAGANVGKVLSVHLTPDSTNPDMDRKARMTLEIEKQFLPMRQNANCTVKPQSLIGEKFISCDPGSPSAEIIPKANGYQTISVKNTSSPVELDDIIGMLGGSTASRFQLLINELGASVAGRGDQLSETIRRANPALKSARDALQIAASQKRALGQLVTATDNVTAELSKHTDDFGGMFVEGSRALKVTADYSKEVDQIIAELPSTLASAKPALSALRDLSRDSTPTLAAFREASPALTTLAKNFSPLVDLTRPNLKSFAKLSEKSVPVLKRAQPRLVELEGVTRALRDRTPSLDSTLDSVMANGTWENTVNLIYQITTATARYDKVSHIVPLSLVFSPCMFYSEVPIKGCNATYQGERAGENRLPQTAKTRFLRSLVTNPPPILSGKSTEAGSTASTRDASSAVSQAVADAIAPTSSKAAK